MIHRLILERIEDDRVILLTEDHQMITLPASIMPTNITTGQQIYCELKTSLIEGPADEHLAKAVLNELLKTDEQ
ncbi:hypothetical protein HGA34_05295 [Candidatus Falkowbacteria bacterium]|nr:hypothetical protein [Candidatus Falkowbacteria bacterium]